MLGYVRQKLRLIRYYSAPRRRTLLTRFVDVALVLAIVLAFPAAWLADAEIRVRAALIECDGHLYRDENGTAAARMIDPDQPRASSSIVPFGEFQVRLIEVRRGWPASSTVVQPAVELDLNRYDQPGVQRNATLATDAPEHGAISAALTDALESGLFHPRHDPEQAAAFADLVERWGRGEQSVRPRILAWAFNVGVCWILLSMLLAGIAAALWTVVMIAIHNRQGLHARRRREGLCVHCGYDLYGLDFNERCPECGSMIY